MKSCSNCMLPETHETIEFDANNKCNVCHQHEFKKKNINWLDKRKAYLWIHCKNLEAAKECWNHQYQAFCHAGDSYTYTSTGKIWLHDLSMKIDDSVIIPMIEEADLKDIKGKPYAICTDYPHLLN